MKWYELPNCPHCGAKLYWNGGSSERGGIDYDAICTKCKIFFFAAECMGFEVEEEEL